MNDIKIIELFFKRDTRAISESKNKYGKYCFTIANNILNSFEDSEECLNDTLFHSWNTIPLTKPNILRLFLAKITRNLAFNKFKAKTTQKRGGGQIELVLDELGECITDNKDVLDQIIAKELGDAINKFLLDLSIRERNIFCRRYFFVESTSIIAKRYNLTENNVKVILSRTRNKLREFLIKEGYFYE